MEATTTPCPKCKLPLLADFYFCPNCGFQLKQKPIEISAMKQLAVYLFSFFLSPLGLYYAFKYLRQSDHKIKLIGWVVIILTILSISITLFFATQFFKQYTTMLDQLSTGNSSF